MPDKKHNDIICFANDWFADPLSKKHIMLRFARTRRVLWINSINNRRPRLAKKDLSRVFQKLKGFKGGIKQVENNIWVLTPLFIPFHGNKFFNDLNRRLLGYQIRRAISNLGLQDPVNWTFVPAAATVAGHLGEKCVVYHCVDEYTAFSDAAGEIRAREADLLKKSQLVVVSSSKLLESKREQNSNTHFVSHGVDFEHFKKATAPETTLAPETAALTKPILGFHGLIADWVDIPLIAGIARMRPDWSIVLIGKVEADLSPFDGLSNIHLIGHRPYSRLPEFLKGFDAAILPFVINELTLAANPLKLREYLAAGLPVISAPLPEVLRMGSLVLTASTSSEYVEIIQRLMREGKLGPAASSAERVRNESWDFKVHQLEELLEETLHKKASVSLSSR
jgi:glycosyltransferase involved in cell wall biosynthesis